MAGSLTSRIISAIFESLKTFDQSFDDFTTGLGRQVIQISKDSCVLKIINSWNILNYFTRKWWQNKAKREIVTTCAHLRPRNKGERNFLLIIRNNNPIGQGFPVEGERWANFPSSFRHLIWVIRDLQRPVGVDTFERDTQTQKLRKKWHGLAEIHPSLRPLSFFHFLMSKKRTKKKEIYVGIQDRESQYFCTPF